MRLYPVKYLFLSYSTRLTFCVSQFNIEDAGKCNKHEYNLHKVFIKIWVATVYSTICIPYIKSDNDEKHPMKATVCLRTVLTYIYAEERRYKKI